MVFGTMITSHINKSFSALISPFGGVKIDSVNELLTP